MPIWHHKPKTIQRDGALSGVGRALIDTGTALAGTAGTPRSSSAVKAWEACVKLAEAALAVIEDAPVEDTL